MYLGHEFGTTPGRILRFGSVWFQTEYSLKIRSNSSFPHQPLWSRKDDGEDNSTTHTHLHAHKPCHTELYIMFYLYRDTHTERERERERERGERSKLRCGFVSLMNLQWDSTESPFTYTYVINTTYYYYRRYRYHSPSRSRLGPGHWGFTRCSIGFNKGLVTSIDLSRAWDPIKFVVSSVYCVQIHPSSLLILLLSTSLSLDQRFDELDTSDFFPPFSSSWCACALYVSWLYATDQPVHYLNLGQGVVWMILCGCDGFVVVGFVTWWKEGFWVYLP